MAAGRKQSHHFVPAFYLAGFADPENPKCLWLYDKARGKVNQSSPRDAGRRRHYHSIPKINGTVDTSVEDGLAKVEGQAAPVLRKLMAGEILDNRERSIVSYFIALMMVRVPTFRDGMEKFKAAVVKDVAQLMAQRGAFDSIPVPEDARESIAKVKKAMCQGEFEVIVRPHASLDVLPAARRLAEVLHRMTWVLLEARGKTRYVVSDNPVTFVDPGDPKGQRPVDLRDRTIEVTFPLSATLALMAGWAGDGDIYRKRVTENMVREVNRRTVAGASRFVYASEKSDQLMRFVMKFKDSGGRWEVR